MTTTLLPENVKRMAEIARDHEEKSKHPGDYHWRKAQMYTGGGDYLDADAGEPPAGARWN